jgi:Fe-S-cluster-containing dehydrogenase component
MPWPKKKPGGLDASEKTSLGKGVFRKCDGCGDCMTACATVKTGTDDKTRSRIQIVGSESDGFELALCRQCGDPKCVTVCPAAALTKNYDTGVIEWNAAKCVDCLLCTIGCTYAGIALTLLTSVSTTPSLSRTTRSHRSRKRGRPKQSHQASIR